MPWQGRSEVSTCVSRKFTRTRADVNSASSKSISHSDSYHTKWFFVKNHLAHYLVGAASSLAGVCPCAAVAVWQTTNPTCSEAHGIQLHNGTNRKANGCLSWHGGDGCPSHSKNGEEGCFTCGSFNQHHEAPAGPSKCNVKLSISSKRR